MPRFSQWRMTPRALFRLMLALLLALAYAYQSRAQEFAPDAIDEILDAEVAEADVADFGPSSEAVRAALASINARGPDNAIDWIKAVVILRRMGAHAEAKPFLDQAINANLDQSGLVALHQALGTAELVGLSVDPQLPEARPFVFAVFSAVRESRRDADALRDAVNSLSSDDANRRGAAILRLVDAGAHAIPAIASALQDTDANASETAMQDVVVRLGKDAEEPLLAMLGAPHAKLQLFAARMLGSIGSKRANLLMVRPYFSGDQETRAAAADYYQRTGAVPTRVEASAAALLSQAEYHLQGNPPVRADVDGLVEIWTWSSDANTIVPHVVDSKAAAAVVAARFARDAYELQPNNASARLLLVSRLQVDQALGGLDELLSREVGSAFQLGLTMGLETIADALQYSLQHGHDAAAQGACELIAHYCQNRAHDGWSGLTHALKHPNRRVRYAAVRAIMAVDPRSPYAGASFFWDALVDLAQASGQPRAIVAMPRRDAADNLSGKLNSMGFSVAEVRQSTRLLSLSSEASNVDVIFLSDSVSRPTARETIQRLRHHRFTKNVPIVLIARNDNLIQADRISDIDNSRKTMVLPEFASEESLQAKLEAAESMVRGIAVSPERRLAQAQDALRWIDHLTQYSQTYSWYDLQRAEDVVMRGATHPELSTLAVPVLGHLGGASPQRLLVDLVGQKDLSLAERQRAANAFTVAVARRGLMLNGAEVDRQYDRYNASEQEDVAVQEVLGQILDVVETQTQPANPGLKSF